MRECIIVIPAYQPTEKLKELVESLRFAWIKKIVCVDDGGGVKYRGIFRKLEAMDKVCVLRHAVNMGKGRALKTAFNHILNEFSDGEVVITVDADGQHTPAAVEKIYGACGGEDSIVLGSREFTNIKNEREIPLRSRFGNQMTKLVFRFLCNIPISDTQTGLRAIPLALLPGFIKVSGEKYEYETNCLLWCKDNGVEIREASIETIYENNNESSHFNPLRDSLRIYMVIVKYMCSSLLSVAMDYAVFFLLACYSEHIFLLTYAGRVCSSVLNFLLNKKIVFGAEGKMLTQALMYFLLVFLSGTISAAAVSALYSVSGQLFLSKVIVETILFFFNFYVQKNMIFVKKGKKR